ncbi:hypothetical protein [Methanohalophilus sp.]|uniref:hypothetical protein n=1 Tax=Methanohalophilus sp. TaxID=1966352 RepID=UPI00260B50FE|nr:hypothetical protein [Methanohalophilus sp.]MDK2892698.1 hypothetical protein [Methanohalophilus sp.]
MKIFNIIFIGLFLICITGTVAAEYSNSAAEDHEALVIEIAKELENTMDDRGIWYEGADDRFGYIYTSDNRHDIEGEMQSLDYWSLDDRVVIGEFPNQVVSSSAEIKAPGPDGKTIYITVDGYNLPAEEIRPVSEWVFNELVRLSVESGAIGEYVGASSDVSPVDDSETAPVESTEQKEEEIIENSPTIGDETPETVESVEIDVEQIEEFIDILEEENVVDVKGTVSVEEISREDVLQYQQIMGTYLLDDNFMAEMESYSIGINALRIGFEYIDEIPAQEIDVSSEQDPVLNDELIKDTFDDDFMFGIDGEVSLQREERYEGEEKVAAKIQEVLQKEKLSKDDRDLIKSIKSGQQAATYFSEDYENSNFARLVNDVDNLNFVKEKVEEIKQVSDDTKKLSQLKGSAGTTTKALYGLAKAGQKLGGNIPVVGKLIERGSEVVEKTVMVMPAIDDAVSNSDFRQGQISSGARGTKTPNAFLDRYGERIETSEGPVYKFKYKDDKGNEKTLSPDLWVISTIKGQTYYIPTDIEGNPIDDVAIMDKTSWKPWTWDNCQVVKYSNPSVVYNDGEVYDL